MPYTPLNWVAGVTPLSEANLDHLETQYDEAVSELGLIVAETEAFASAAAPDDTFTDLNLSAIVGANKALVLIKVTNGVGSTRGVCFRLNGDAEPTVGQRTGCSALYNTANSIGYIITATDANGIVEWTGDSVSQTTTLDVVAFIPVP